MSDVEQALRMIGAFLSVGVTNFDLSVIRYVNGPAGRTSDERVDGKQLNNSHFRELRFRIGKILIEAEQEHWSVIIRPRRETASSMIVQLDDLPAETAENIKPYAFLIVLTSPSNHQSWVAVADADAGELARRLQRGVGADTNASGAGRIAGSRNWKPRHGPTFPLVEISYLLHGHTVTHAELESAGLVAAPSISTRKEPAPSVPPRPSTGLWPEYAWVLARAPMRKDGSGRDRSIADAFWCKLSAARGHSIEEIAAMLLRVSEKAQEEIAHGYVNYALDKARWGARAAGGRMERAG
jgi:RepB DNA-primase from phage plasmid